MQEIISATWLQDFDALLELNSLNVLLLLLGVVLLLLSSASILGSIIAYLQGRWLHNTPFMRKAELTLPNESLPKAKKLLNRFGFLSLFVSRIVPFVRVLTPVLMGVAQLSTIRTLIVSFTSSITWVFSLLLVGKLIIRHPFAIQYQELITKWFLISSLISMLTTSITLFIRLATKKPQLQTID